MHVTLSIVNIKITHEEALKEQKARGFMAEVVGRRKYANHEWFASGTAVV